MKTRVVITGVGLLSGWGAGKDNFARFLKERSHEIAIEDIDFDTYVDTSLVRRADYFSRCALVAAKLALEDSGLLAISKEKSSRTGIVLGTAHGALHYTLEYHSSLVLGDPRLASPLLFSDSVHNVAVSHISTALGIRGYTTTTSGYCAVIQALRIGIQLIQKGLLDVCLVGGADVNHEFLTKIYGGCLTDPELINKNLGGSGFIVIESLAHAVQRKARVYAQIEGLCIITSMYETVKRHAISPLKTLLSQTNGAFKEEKYLLSASYDEKDCLRRRELFLKEFKGTVFECSNSFGYGFSASEAFQLILCVLGTYSVDYVSSFNAQLRLGQSIDHLFLLQTALVGTNACTLLSRYDASKD